jgi:dihydroneopterin aldolase
VRSSPPGASFTTEYVIASLHIPWYTILFGTGNGCMERIVLKDISVRTFIGVGDKERSRRQRLFVSVELEPKPAPAGRGDRLENTIDYSAVRQVVKRILLEERFHLIETAAERIALSLKHTYQLKSLTVEVKKRPYRDTRYCAYRLSI